MGIRELKKRNRSKLLFGGVDIKKYASVDYIRDLLKHRREVLERPQDIDVTEGTVDPEDVDVALEGPIGDMPPLGENPALDQVGSLTNVVEQNPLPAVDAAQEQGNNPPSAIDDALAAAANLTNQLATTAPEQPNNQLDVPTGVVVPSSVADDVESNIHPTDANLTNQLANEHQNNQLDTSTANLVEGDIHPTDAALNNISQLVGSFEKPDEEQFSEPTIGTQSISENPAIASLNLISSIVEELASQQPSAVPSMPVTGPVVTGPSTSAAVPPGPVQSGPTDEALDNILKFTQSLVSPLSTQTPPTIDAPPIIETPPSQPNTSSSFLPKFSASGMLSGLNSLLPDDEDMTQYEVEEYTTALGSDVKQNERKTMYNSDGATSGQHKWRAPPAPANQSSQV